MELFQENLKFTYTLVFIMFAFSLVVVGTLVTHTPAKKRPTNFIKISADKNNELQRNFLFGSPDLLIERIIEDSKGVTLSDLANIFVIRSRFYHRSIKRHYPNPTIYHSSQRIGRL